MLNIKICVVFSKVSLRESVFVLLKNLGWFEGVLVNHDDNGNSVKLNYKNSKGALFQQSVYKDYGYLNICKQTIRIVFSL